MPRLESRADHPDPQRPGRSLDEHVGIRVFTAANVAGLTLTTEAANTGQWYGSGDFKQVYQELWGVSQ